MCKYNELRRFTGVVDIDGILAGVDQASYLEAIRNSCTSFAATHDAESPSIEKIYLYVRPEYFMAMAAADGKDPSVALGEWLTAVRGMLTEYRKARRKSVLFEVASTLKYCKREVPLESAHIDLALAALAVYRSEEIKSTLDELAASSVPLVGWNRMPQLDLAGISRQYHQLHKDSTGLRDENSRLKIELDQQKEHLAQLEGEIKDQSVKHKELSDENDLLLLQLRQVQEELEQYYLKLQTLPLKDEKNDPQHADSEHEPPTLTRSSKPKSRSAFVRKIAALKRLRSEAALLKSSPLFDGEWYLQQYPDVAKANVDPARHYLRFGAAEGRNPGPEFNTEWYLRKYPDVAESGMNALVHYLKYGKSENRMKTEWSWN